MEAFLVAAVVEDFVSYLAAAEILGRLLLLEDSLDCFRLLNLRGAKNGWILALLDPVLVEAALLVLLAALVEVLFTSLGAWAVLASAFLDEK